MRRTSLLVCCLAVVVPGLGLAQEGEADRVGDPCAADVMALCPNVEPGSARVLICLREKKDSLSTSCRQKLEADTLKARAVLEEFGRACRADVSQFCGDVEPGGGRVLGCLSQHQLELSNSCQSMLKRIDEARERVTVFRRACAADTERLCKAVAGQAGPLLECLQANEANLSSDCSAGEVREIMEASSLVDTIEEMSRKERVREVLQVLQGLDSVAFSRSQVLLQVDAWQGLKNQANGGRLLFNPQFVFGSRTQFSFQLKVPVTGIFPDAAGAPVRFGLGATTAVFTWNFLSVGRTRQYAGLGLQMPTGSTPGVGGPWALVPSYAIAVGLTRWLSFTAQVLWFRSLGTSSSSSELNLLVLEPIVVVNLPGRSFLALDTRLGWDFPTSTFIPLLKGVAGLYVDQKKSLSITAWYQTTLTNESAAVTFKYGVGLGLAYYFDW